MVGDPVDHSLSPVIHAAAFRVAGIAATYVRLRVDGEGMAEVVADVRRGGLDGLNVTMPHKALAARLVDHTAGSARRTGAVNTVTRIGERLVGHNTDVVGVITAWGASDLPTDAPVVVLGGGGAAAAVLVALHRMGAATVRVTGRRPEALAALVTHLGVAATVEPLERVDGRGAVVVNATPLGMHGEPLPVDVTGAAGVFDLAYGADRTPAVAAASSAGVPVVDGVTMLVAQAAESFRLWTGREADRRAMLDAAAAARGTVAP